MNIMCLCVCLSVPQIAAIMYVSKKPRSSKAILKKAGKKQILFKASNQQATWSYRRKKMQPIERRYTETTG